MTTHKELTVTVSVDENPQVRTTVAHACLHVDGHRYVGTGTAIRYSRDPDVPSVGEDLATARALNDVARQLAVDAYADLDDAGARMWDDV